VRLKKEMMRIKSSAGEETYMVVEMFGKPALFTDNLIDRGTVPLCFIHIYFYLCYTIFQNSAKLSISIPPQLSICLSLPDLFKLF
jgi:hypothetical protein